MSGRQRYVCTAPRMFVLPTVEDTWEVYAGTIDSHSEFLGTVQRLSGRRLHLTKPDGEYVTTFEGNLEQAARILYNPNRETQGTV